ncbi:MAG: prenyltransferase, partial [Bacteroidetes bacterium]
MLDYLKLFRFPNLIILALILYLIRYAVIERLLVSNGMALQLSVIDFSLLVLATLLITAAGYAINDYFDTKADLKNRPDAIVVGRTIKRRVAMVLHIVLSVI